VNRIKTKLSSLSSYKYETPLSLVKLTCTYSLVNYWTT